MAKLRTSGSASAEPPRASAAYAGTLQGVGNGHALGWVWDPSDPARRVAVTVTVDGEPVAEGIADLQRDDLAGQGLGDGAHGFLVGLPETLSGPGRRTIAVLAGVEGAVIRPSAGFWSQGGPGTAWEATLFVAPAAKPVDVPPAPVLAPPEVLEGPDGWLFEAEDLRVAPAPASGELTQLRDRFRALHDALAEIRIPYLLVRVPAKHVVLGFGATVYGESVQRLWVEPLMNLLCDEDGVEMFDLLPALRGSVRHGSGFSRTDPYWNARGAFFAARAMLKETSKRAPELRPAPLSELHLRRVPGHRGSLADLGADLPGLDRHPAEEAVAPDEHHLKALRMPVEDHLVGDRQTHVRLYAKEGEKGPGLAVVGDGCCEPLLPWLADRAARTTFFWADSPPLEPIELEMPGVVIHLVRDSRLPSLAATSDPRGAPWAP